MEKLELILDTNIIISALMNENSIIRDILVSNKINFFAPEFVLDEIEKHRELIQTKGNLTEMEFYFILGYLMRNVKLIKKEYFSHNLQEAKNIMEDVDVYDSEFLALGMSIPNDGIFSNDDDFDETELKRWSVMEVIDWLEKK